MSTTSQSSVPRDQAAASDVHTWRVVAAEARFDPERYSHFGYAGADDEVHPLAPGIAEEQMAVYGELLAELGQRRATETDPEVRADLDFLIGYCELKLGHCRLEDELLLPYLDLPRILFIGFRTLLDERVEPGGRPRAAAARLRRYSGAERGFVPIAHRFREALRARLRRPGLLAPCREAVERELRAHAAYRAEIGRLLEQCSVPGYEKLWAKLCQQTDEWCAFVREAILPRARASLTLPRELYSSYLRHHGVDMPVDELVSRAKAELRHVRWQLELLARRLAGRKSSAVDYRTVLGKVEAGGRIAGAEVLAHYRRRFRQVRELIERHDVLTLPAVAPRLVAASGAASAAWPFPHVLAPPVLGGGDGPIEIVLPRAGPMAEGGRSVLHDATCAPSSWLVAIHETAHALQFAALGVGSLSLARRFLRTSVRTEGWAISIETELVSYLPPAAQMAFLRSQLLRAVRTVLEARLREGAIGREQAARVLREDVVLSQAAVDRELSRLYLLPGQAPAYFCGGIRASELRAETELALGRRFRRRSYHDFVLAQGFVPFSLLCERVLEGFVLRALPSGDAAEHEGRRADLDHTSGSP